MAMKILNGYNKEEIFKELQEKLPILKYHKEDDEYYELLYYGYIPMPWEIDEKIDRDFIRFWYIPDADKYCYIAKICGKEDKHYKICNFLTIEQVVGYFKKDIEKSKKKHIEMKLSQIDEDF